MIDKAWEVYVMFCAIWYSLHNLKNVKNTHGEVLLLVKLQAASKQQYYHKYTSLAKKKRSWIRSCDSRIELKPGTESSQTPNQGFIFRF